MASNKACKKWSTCAKLKNQCKKTLGMVLGNTGVGKKCKQAIGNQNAKMLVNEVCKNTCKNCGKIIST